MIATVGVAPCFLLNSLSFAAMIVALRAMDPARARAGTGGRARARRAAGGPALRRRHAGAGGAAGDDGAGRDARLQLPGDPAAARAASSSTAAPAPTACSPSRWRSARSPGRSSPGARNRVDSRLIVGSALAFGLLAITRRRRADARARPRSSWCRSAPPASLFAAGINSKLQLTAEPMMRGRVMALYSMVFLGTTPIGGPIAGALSGALGPARGPAADRRRCAHGRAPAARRPATSRAAGAAGARAGCGRGRGRGSARA